MASNYENGVNQIENHADMFQPYVWSQLYTQKYNHYYIACTCKEAQSMATWLSPPHAKFGWYYYAPMENADGGNLWRRRDGKLMTNGDKHIITRRD